MNISATISPCDLSSSKYSNTSFYTDSLKKALDSFIFPKEGVINKNYIENSYSREHTQECLLADNPLSNTNSNQYVYHILKDSIKHKQVELHLKKVLLIKMYVLDDHCYAENTELNVLGIGITRKDAINDFKSTFIELYEIYLIEKDINLTLDAQKTKKLFLDIVQNESTND